jgi:hypothetical protein
MARGDRSRTWFPEMASQLRAAWRPDATWDAIIDLRHALQQTLDHIISSRGIIRARVRCPSCGEVGPGAPPVVTVGGVLFALGRFGIESDETARRLYKAWTKYRALHHLDPYGAHTTPPPLHAHAQEAGEQGIWTPPSS